MSEQSLTTGEKLDVDVDEMVQDAGITAEEGLTIELDADAPPADDEPPMSATESGPTRRPRARPKSSDTVRPSSEFDPTSRGDERGEVM